MEPLIPIDEANFSDALRAAPQLFLLEFTAQWCPPCRTIAPIVRSIAAEQSGRLSVGIADLDVSAALAAQFGVRGAPTLILFSGGRELGRHLGATSKGRLLAWLDGLSAPTLP